MRKKTRRRKKAVIHFDYDVRLEALVKTYLDILFFILLTISIDQINAMGNNGNGGPINDCHKGMNA